jgi:hypothetical protein
VAILAGDAAAISLLTPLLMQLPLPFLLLTLPWLLLVPALTIIDYL